MKLTYQQKQRKIRAQRQCAPPSERRLQIAREMNGRLQGMTTTLNTVDQTTKAIHDDTGKLIEMFEQARPAAVVAQAQALAVLRVKHKDLVQQSAIKDRSHREEIRAQKQQIRGLKLAFETDAAVDPSGSQPPVPVPTKSGNDGAGGVSRVAAQVDGEVRRWPTERAKKAQTMASTKNGAAARRSGLRKRNEPAKEKKEAAATSRKRRAGLRSAGDANNVKKARVE